MAGRKKVGPYRLQRLLATAPTATLSIEARSGRSSSKTPESRDVDIADGRRATGEAIRRPSL